MKENIEIQEFQLKMINFFNKKRQIYDQLIFKKYMMEAWEFMFELKNKEQIENENFSNKKISNQDQNHKLPRKKWSKTWFSNQESWEK